MSMLVSTLDYGVYVEHMAHEHTGIWCLYMSMLTSILDLFSEGGSADYLVTGTWSSKAANEVTQE
jgi:hypothetical protein